MTNEAYTLQDHLGELRKRLINCVIVFCVAFGAAYAVSDFLISFLFLPVKESLPQGSTMVFTALTEGFMAHLKVAFWAAMVVTAPFTLYQTWRFLLPALYEHEKRSLRRLILTSCALFVFGAVFGYWVILPVILSLSLGYASTNLQALPRLQNYLIFTLKSIFLFGIIFEVPFVMAGAAKLGLIPKDYFKKHRKPAYLLLFLVAAVLVPSDIFSQLLIFMPFVIIYEVGAFLASRF
ncbi:MAG: twin-arginine translocase subunit TatC [Thermodesulfobacteria bacterium]|nr:twin-arginine translocase subunit TatC [Thermodesulfobacteriota bacterium]